MGQPLNWERNNKLKVQTKGFHAPKPRNPALRKAWAEFRAQQKEARKHG